MADHPTTTDASPTGIAECLRMLADEAASLRLVHTVMALLETVEICRREAQATLPAASELATPGDATGRARLIVH
jgi:hypothetical protein